LFRNCSQEDPTRFITGVKVGIIQVQGMDKELGLLLNYTTEVPMLHHAPYRLRNVIPLVLVGCLAFLLVPLTMTAVASAQESPESATLDDYPLDSVSREVKPTGRVKCPKVELVRYRGDVIRYHKPVKVFVGFKDRLKKFEKVVEEVAIEVYGRAPRRIRHIGTYNCRRIGGYPTFISEHGLGNGIDIAGFDFGRLPRGEELPEGVSKRLKRSFKVRMLKHWDGKGRNAIHSRFLKTLARRLIARDDIFRVLLGPSYPGHKDHFHFDCSPWRIVEVFEADER